MNKLKLLAGVGIVALLSLSPAKATTITTDSNSILFGYNINITSTFGPLLPTTAHVGQVVFEVDAASKSSVGGASEIPAWCIDLFHSIGGGSYQFDLGTLNTLTTDQNGNPLLPSVVSKMAGLIEVGNGILQGGLLGLGAANNVTGTLSADKNDWSAAVQLAIWDTEYNVNLPGTYGASLGWNGGTANTLAIYNFLLTDNNITGNASDLLSNPVGDHQSFGYTSAQINLTSVPVPEPASLALFGTALVGFGAIKRRRKRGPKTDAV